MSMLPGSVSGDPPGSRTSGTGKTEERHVTQQPDSSPESPESSGHQSTATGHPQVDAVLASLDTLSELPVDQHVGVFEAAHAGLREALSGAGQAAEPTGA
jgi:hypothetical protein